MEVGIDIVKIPRMEGKEDLAKKILSKEEYSLYQKRTDKAQFLAGRFAAREAFLKAKKGTINYHDFSNIRVMYDDYGAPYLEYLNVIYKVSIAHDGDYAIAIVVVE